MPPWLDRLQRGALLMTAFLYSAGYATAGLLALLLIVIIEGIVLHRVPWQRSGLDAFVAAFIGIFLLSGALSEYRPMAIATTGLAALTIYLALGTTARTLRRHASFLRPLLWAWLLGGAAAAVLAIVLYVRTGTPAHTPELGYNAVGTTMLIATFIGFGLVLWERTPWRYLSAALGMLSAGALALSYARGAWMGLLLGFVVVAAIGGRRVARSALLALVVIGLTGVVLAGAHRPALISRAKSIGSLNLYRVYLFQAAWNIFTDHPVIGTGMNTFPMVYPHYRLPGDVNDVAQPYAHNIFLNFADEGGILGLAAFLAILGRTLQLGWRWWAAAAPEDRAFRAALLAAFASMLGHQLFDGTLISVHLGAGMWMVMAMLTAFHRTDA